MESSTGATKAKHVEGLRHRKAAPEKAAPIVSIEEEVPEKANPTKPSQFYNYFTKLEPIVVPLLFTVFGLYVRLFEIDKSKEVVWDEAHFGKFGSYYIKHEFYHDVHPPLGKMLIALSEYIAGFNGDFEFKSGTKYPEHCDFTKMRIFNAVFSGLCVPVTYFIGTGMHFRREIVYLLTLMVTLEASYIALGKFILLDSILLFFTATTFLTMIEIHNLRMAKKEFTPQWYLWMILSGISIGCVCSVKWVGLFITVVVGAYTIQDLGEKFFDSEISWSKYAKHWSVRILSLIFIPLTVYLICFKIHFALLYKSGTGDSSTSSLFQVNLENNKIQSSPRDILYGSEITVRSQGLSPNLLHSHVQKYPDGSNQQQITGYGHSDANNNWVLKYSRRSKKTLPNNDTTPVLDGDIVRIVHKNTGVNLHSHDIPGHVSKQFNEVAGYGNEKVGDSKDDWKIEIVEQLPSRNSSYPIENSTLLHPLSTSFRLKHADLGCYLATTGKSYPSWGFKQSEVICKPSWSKSDKATWWNIEHHKNPILEIDETYIPPKSNFWSDFISINFAMAASNNALVPDSDKLDHLASEWWQWPTLYLGLRMCGWGRRNVRYFLIGNVFNTWLSTLSIIGFLLVSFTYLMKFQRQSLEWKPADIYEFLIKGVYPFFGWLIHFLPFVVMSRVTYVHHYVPALYFAIFVFGYILELVLSHVHCKYIRNSISAVLFVAMFSSWYYFRPFHDGMVGDNINYEYLKWFKTWRVV